MATLRTPFVLVACVMRLAATLLEATFLSAEFPYFSVHADVGVFQVLEG